MKTHLIRSMTSLVLAGALIVPAAAPAAAQDAPALPALPGVGEVTDLADLVDIAGLDLLDPVLQPVTDVVGQLTGVIDDVLAETPLPNLLSLQGEDAIDAAVAFSQATYETSGTALIARDDLFADALTTGALQGIFDAPLLLTESGDLDRRTAQELVRLGVERLVILGGEDAITPLVRQKLEVAGIDVVRVGGLTRIETAVDAARQAAPDATTAVLTRAYSAGDDDSQAYADLLAVSPWAAQNGWPVLLTESETLTDSAREHIAASSLTEIVVIGGASAIADGVVAELESMGLTVRRVAGDTRYGTAVAVAAERGFADSGAADRMILAEGASARPDIWAPGFAAAAHGARNDAPVLLTNGATIPAETLAFITDGIASNVTDGGPATMCASFVDPIACEAAGLLLLGNLTDALDLLDLGLLDVPGLEGLLGQLGLGDLSALLDSLDGVVDGIISGVSAGDLDAVVTALSDVTGQVEGLVDGVLGGLPTGGDGGTGDVTDIIDDVLGGLGGLLGGAGTGGDDPVGGIVDDLIGGGDDGGDDDSGDDGVGGILDDLLGGLGGGLIGG